MRRFPILHIVLFMVTFFTTLAAGALQVNADLIEHPGDIVAGFPFAITLMSILLVHELSHFAASRLHHAEATLPYFIPAPSLIGTFGAFIKMKSPIPTRAALIDIGASGPIAGFFVSVVACIVGLYLSPVIPVQQNDGMMVLGDSLLFSLLSWLVVGTIPPQFDILLHPIAFAGWIGLFVTSINLLPIGQLDGGHITYALFGRFHSVISSILVGVLGALGTASLLWGIAWEGWLVWAMLMLLLGLEHPPVLFPEYRLDPLRRKIGFFSFVVFIITFVPAPFQFL
jgi:membrane-associated protease RseP (regulator of RpoE activity)